MKLNQQEIDELITVKLSNKSKNLFGIKQDRLTFLKPAENINGRIYWWVQCECGEVEKIRSDTSKKECSICSVQTKKRNLKGKKMIDITNQKFNYLTALYPTEQRAYGKIVWHCKCDCGNECNVASYNLINGITKSCGCLKVKTAQQMGLNQIKDLTNQTFGYLTALYPTEKRQGTSVVWYCKCSCGNFHEVSSSDLLKGSIKSCGCQQYNKDCLKIDMIGKRFGNLIVIQEDKEKDTDGSYKYICQCDCGNIKSISGCSLRDGTTKSCGCIQYSIGEKNIQKILNENNLKYIKEYKITELNNKRFDFAIFNNENIIRLIEFDGRQHYESYQNEWEEKYPLEERQKRDQMKNEWAAANNIPLVRIPYWERDNITLEIIMGDKYLVR